MQTGDLRGPPSFCRAGPYRRPLLLGWRPSLSNVFTVIFAAILGRSFHRFPPRCWVCLFHVQKEVTHESHDLQLRPLKALDIFMQNGTPRQEGELSPLFAFEAHVFASPKGGALHLQNPFTTSTSSWVSPAPRRVTCSWARSGRCPVASAQEAEAAAGRSECGFGSPGQPSSYPARCVVFYD